VDAVVNLKYIEAMKEKSKDKMSYLASEDNTNVWQEPVGIFMFVFQFVFVLCSCLFFSSCLLFVLDNVFETL